MVGGHCKITLKRSQVQGRVKRWGQMVHPHLRTPPLCKLLWVGLQGLRNRVCDEASVREPPCPGYGDSIIDRYRIQSERTKHSANTNRDRTAGKGTPYSPLGISLRGCKLGWLAAILYHKERGRNPEIGLPRGKRADGEKRLSWCGR